MNQVELQNRLAELEKAHRAEVDGLNQAQQAVNERTKRVIVVEGMMAETRYWLEQARAEAGKFMEQDEPEGRMGT